MIVIYNDLFPLPGFCAILIICFLFIKKKCKSYFDEYDFNHEHIHQKQIMEMLVIFFYIFYIIEYLIKLLITFSFKRAYNSISFEQEAYTKMYNLNYLEERKHYKWFKYVFKLVS